MDTSDGTNYDISGVMDISLVCNNVMRAYLYFCMIIEIRQRALGAWSKIFECNTNMARLCTWLASALECCLQFSRRLAQNRELRERWQSFLPVYEVRCKIAIRAKRRKHCIQACQDISAGERQHLF